MFVVRDHSPSHLTAFGDLSPEDLDRLANLSDQLRHVSRSAVFVDYSRAEQLADELAELLVARYGHSNLLEFEFRAVPRGGLVVLGMLSYALSLPRECLRHSDRSDRPVVLVDDCALSGVRIREHISAMPDRRVTVATLCSPPTFESAAIGLCPNVDACISPVHLADLGPELLGDRYDEWLAEQRQRLSDTAIWFGRPEFVCFAWNEPESSFVNRRTGEVERGFRLVSAPSEDLPDTDGVRVHRDGPGPYNAPPWVTAADLDGGRVAVADFSGKTGTSTSSCYLLEDSAAEIWIRLIERGTVEAAASAVAEQYAADPQTVAADVARLAGELVERGLLTCG